MALSGFLNFYSVRKGELVTGINVSPLNSEEDFGKSQIAAKQAIIKACISRFSYTIPMFFTPVLVNECLNKFNLLKPKSSPIRLVTEITGVGIGLYLAIGLNCSIYPQYVPIDVNELEPEIKAKALARGINTLYFNKGI